MRQFEFGGVDLTSFTPKGVTLTLATFRNTPDLHARSEEPHHHPAKKLRSYPPGEFTETVRVVRSVNAERTAAPVEHVPDAEVSPAPRSQIRSSIFSLSRTRENRIAIFFMEVFTREMVTGFEF